MDNSVVIFINEEAVNIEELFLNEDWKLYEMFERIYSITVKNIKLKWLVKTYDKKYLAERESNSLKTLRKVPGIPRLLAVGLSNKLNYIILSEAPGLDLFEYIKKKDTLNERTIKIIAKQLLTTLKLTHEHGIIHKDIKPENIIYDEQTKKITLIDFEEKYTTTYQSPEHIKGKKPNEKTDIWSCGITLYYLKCGYVPFETEKDIISKKLKLPSKWTANFKDFISCLLERDVDLRYNAKEALNHIWLTE